MKIKKDLPNGGPRCCFTHDEIGNPQGNNRQYYKHDSTKQCLNLGKYSYKNKNYCTLHSPEHSSDNFGSIKAKYLQEAIHECNKNGSNKSIRFVGASFDEIDLQNQTINAGIEFIDCEFLNIVDLMSSKLKSKLYFRNCHFDLSITFN